MLIWEQIDNYHQRAKVFGGWLVKAYEDKVHYALDKYDTDIWRAGHDLSLAMAFVPDSKHEWEIKEKGA